MNVFVVFGSASDESISLPLVKALSAADEVEYQVISAHRNLERLQEKIAAWRGDAIVAGAGLAAALPGVVAAMTKLPVFGVPVPSQFGGLDSLCSIAQMPPGVPVMTCGPWKPDAIVGFIAQWKSRASNPGERIHFVTPPGVEAKSEIAKAQAAASEKNVAVSCDESADATAFNVRFVANAEDVRPDDFCMHVPYFDRSAVSDPARYLNVLEWMNRGGVWVGVNNTRNAVHSFLRLKGIA